MRNTNQQQNYQADEAFDHHSNAPLAPFPERRRFNLWLTSSDSSWIDGFYHECYPLGGTRKHRATFDTIMNNLAVAEDEAISVFLDKSRYRHIQNKPSSFSASNVSRICDMLENKGFLELKWTPESRQKSTGFKLDIQRHVQRVGAAPV
ncbi:hypothetical protein SAMN02745124_04334 [Desulfofustis glycolicus DSM 9705]|uniref:Uncharacterized protein n=1 Tax=Desulfofustis glycolicus DSM 9705 TaxID=1121409 RepID=A0A1M5YR04_9BACT|nr:hypothetical protein SAMN02745124_04334 [Desulfofustis glycolicus DSM 9705]